MIEQVRKNRVGGWVCGLIMTLSSVFVFYDYAGAFVIPTGNEDVKANLDNTLRYTLAQRLRGQNKDILNSPQNDDGDRNFDVGLVSSRLDVLTEFDVIYKKNYGVRVSGASWYDPIYRDSLDNRSNTSNHVVNGAPKVGLPNYTKDHFGGVYGELLDAFAFAKIQVGEVPINVRVGRHTVYWGESFLPYGGANGISAGQSPLDLGKALAMPGVELKEVFRPLNQVSLQVQPTKELTIAGQYYLQWESNAFPESGSYLGFADPYLNGGESLWTPAGPITNGGDIKPKQARDWGISARWNPEWLDGTLGFYYRNYSDKMPHLLVDVSHAGPTTMPTYRFSYADNIDLFGISLAKNILGVSVGAEISYRKNMPLSSLSGIVVGAPGTPAVPGAGDTAGARGETMHALINFLGLLPKTLLFDAGSYLAEFSYSRWMSVSQGNAYFLGRDGYTGADRVTRDNMTAALNLTPQWFQVFPGVDLTMPLSIASGLFGSSSVAGGGAASNGSYSAGLSFDIFNKYKVDITYASFFGTYGTDATGGIPGPGGSAPGEHSGAGDIFALLKDRDMLSLTLKTTF
jgi:hypothetical protein